MYIVLRNIYGFLFFRDSTELGGKMREQESKKLPRSLRDFMRSKDAIKQGVPPIKIFKSKWLFTFDNCMC